MELSPNALRPVPPPRRRQYGRWLLIIVLAAAACGLAWWLGTQTWIDQTVSNVVAVNEPANTAATAEVTRIVDAGVTWKIVTAPLADQKLLSFSVDQTGGSSTITYYQVGTDDRGGRYVLGSTYVGMGSYASFLFKQDATKAWSVLTRYSSMDTLNSDDLTMAKEVTSSDSALASLDLPVRLELTSGTIVQDPSLLISGDQMTANDNYVYTVVAQTKYGPLYRRATKKAPGSTTTGSTEALMLARNDGRYAAYQLTPSFLRDDQTLNVTAASGVTLSGKYNIFEAGCGFSSSVTVLSDDLVSGRTQVATAADGVIYALTDSNNPLVKNYYEDYQSSRSYDGSTYKVATQAEYLAAYPILIWQDMFGRWVVLRNADYGALAECGKPVVYLYPTKTTAVSVKVDADVTVSEPKYSDGWLATAEPSGRLTVAGKSYPYLFWEGFGHGRAADLTGVGTVVAQHDLLPTLRQQMTQLGLTAQEQADFLAFWQPRLPQTSYVRLTWMGTSEMEQVAKLTINPQPDTLIRVFLDFAGLSAPQTLRAQRLTAPVRQGFVAVEWGGSLSSR